MIKINNIEEFNNEISNVDNFSHAYLLNTNSLSRGLLCAKELAKKIICHINGSYDSEMKKEICYQIDNDEYDDLYIVNPETIGINTEEIEKLFQYMKTKSLRNDGKRVYIIYGYERLSRDVSNKILKFLEEPVDNLYAILLTQNIDKILSTIVSRCQILNINFNIDEMDENLVELIKKFLVKLFLDGNKTISSVNEYFGDICSDRLKMYDAFQIIENIFSNIIKKKIQGEYKENLYVDNYEEISIDVIVKIMDISNKIKMLIKENVNLNLLLDRFIIEVSKELKYAKDSRSSI